MVVTVGKFLSHERYAKDGIRRGSCPPVGAVVRMIFEERYVEYTPIIGANDWRPDVRSASAGWRQAELRRNRRRVTGIGAACRTAGSPERFKICTFMIAPSAPR